MGSISIGTMLVKNKLLRRIIDQVIVTLFLESPEQELHLGHQLNQKSQAKQIKVRLLKMLKNHHHSKILSNYCQKKKKVKIQQNQMKNNLWLIFPQYKTKSTQWNSETRGTEQT